MKKKRVKVELESILVQLQGLILKLGSAEGSQYYKSDARKVILIGLQNELQFYSLSIRLSRNLEHQEFFESEKLKTPSETDRQIILDNHLHSVSVSFLILIVTHFENYLRLVAANRNSEKHSVSKTFDALKLEFNLTENDKNFFKTIFNIRNSFHNGGFFGHSDETTQIDEVSYKFENGQVVNFPNKMSFIENNLFLIDYLISFVSKMNELTKSVSLIEHNYSKIQFLDEE